MLSVLYSLDPKLTLNFFVIYISCSMLFIADLPENIFDKIIIAGRLKCLIFGINVFHIIAKINTDNIHFGKSHIICRLNHFGSNRSRSVKPPLPHL